ncbi:hypothetical protein [Planctomyces sp. SH-PL62]|uniref:hypothetical protein n=1 Tax=Planctomyces sp. SH-PL62 TaxID=1636152 RepID=UPI0012E7FBD7|nr:hypothetical protein [Planctomyces sp. SH-PL62]
MTYRLEKGPFRHHSLREEHVTYRIPGASWFLRVEQGACFVIGIDLIGMKASNRPKREFIAGEIDFPHLYVQRVNHDPPAAPKSFSSPA